jgi:hypothetical protein
LDNFTAFAAAFITIFCIFTVTILMFGALLRRIKQLRWIYLSGREVYWNGYGRKKDEIGARVEIVGAEEKE